MSEIHTYHANLTSALQAAFPALRTVAAYRIGETLTTPAVLIEIESMRVGDGNTPTGVGKTHTALALFPAWQKHPHGRGEDLELKQHLLLYYLEARINQF